MTINDIAKELNVSPSTVSRAISGKGRIGKETRDLILNYIKEHDFHPNAVAQSLAGSKTNNIAIIMPDIKSLEDMPFFQMCMYGVFETAGANGYDLMVVTSDGKDTKYLDRLIRNHKVDGMILTRTYTDGRLSNYLKVNDMPFVAVGKASDDVLQIDHDHFGASEEMTSLLIMKGMKKISFFGTDMEQCVNNSRLDGFKSAFKKFTVGIDNELIFTNLVTTALIEAAVEQAISSGSDCIVCQDDFICNVVVKKIASMNLSIPGDIKIASLYDSQVLDDYLVPISSLKFDIMDLGRKSCKMLIDLLEGSEVESPKLLDFEISLRESTK